MSKTDWYGIFFILLVPVIATGIIISIMKNNFVSASGYYLAATLLVMYWTEHKRGGVVINLKDDHPTSGILGAFIAGFIGGAVFLFVFLMTLAPMILAIFK